MRGPSSSGEIWLRDAEPRLIVRRDGSVAAVSDAFERLSGWPAGSALEQPLTKLLVPLDPPEFPALPALSAAGGFEATVGLGGREGAPPTAALLKLRAAPETGELFVSLLPLPSFTGLDSGANASEASALPPSPQAAQQLRAILDELPGFSYTVDRSLTFTSSAGAGLACLNLKESQLVGASLFELWGTRDPSYEPLACHLRALAGLTQT